MSEPTTTWAQVGSYHGLPIIAVTFGGVYPPGSAGNEFAQIMIKFLRGRVASSGAVGVVVDLTKLHYVSGDAIGGLATALMQEGTGSFRPSAIVAAGETAAALQQLLGPNFVMGLADMKLVQTREEGLAVVRDVLEKRTPAQRIERKQEAAAPSAPPSQPAQWHPPRRSPSDRSAEAAWIAAMLFSAGVGALISLAVFLRFAPGRDWRVTFAIAVAVGLVSAAGSGKMAEGIARVVLISVVLGLAWFLIPRLNVEASLTRAFAISLYAAASSSHLLMALYNDFFAKND